MFSQMMFWLKSINVSEKGQTLAEYALILALIAIVVIVALTALGPLIAATYDAIAAEL